MGKMPLSIQIPQFRARFEKLNAPLAADLIDFEAHTSKTLEFDENIEALADAYPQYVWSPEQEYGARFYEKEVIAGLQKEADEYDYSIIKDYKLETLERGARTSKKYKGLLDECKALKPHVKKRKRKPKKTCPPSEKIKVTFLRCP